MRNEIPQYVVAIGDIENTATRDEFLGFMNSEKFTLSSNGVLYRTDKVGVIPEILSVWFDQRLKFKEYPADMAEIYFYNKIYSKKYEIAEVAQW